MNFDTVQFAVFCAAAIIVLNLSRGERARPFAIMVLNLIFVASFVSSAAQLAPLAAFVVVGYGAIVLSARVRPNTLLVLVALVVAVFIWLKQYTIVGFLPRLAFPYLLIGLSYILFRIVHLMVEVNQGAQSPPGPLHYAAYLLFFLTFISGPIQRHEEFARQVADAQLPQSVEEVHSASTRIVFGLFLVAVVAQFTFYIFSHLEPRLYACLTAGHFGLKALVLYAAVAMAFAVHLYMNFSGYMEIVIGIGMLCGFRLPENFDRPYLATNFLDFWSRWHITLSTWFKFYLFNPVLKWWAERWGSPATMPYLGAAAFFVTFLTMGLWHGSTKTYLIYGLFLGFGVTANKLYDIEVSKRFGKNFCKDLRERQSYRHLSRALTLAYFSIALTCLWFAPPQVPAVVTGFALGFGAAALILLTGCLFVLGTAIATVASFLTRHAPAFRNLLPEVALPPWVAPICTGAKLYIVVNLALIAGSAPEFVYKVF